MRMSREGFILPTVLLVLILFTAAAMAAAAMAHQQVRSASSLRVSVMAFHAAEGGASWIVNGFVDESLQWLPSGVIDGSDLEDVGEDIPWNEDAPAPHGDAVWWVESITFAGDEATILVHGELPQLGARRTIETVVDRGEPASQSPWADGLVGCDGVTISQNGNVDSWNSLQDGPYSWSNRQENASVRTVNIGSDIAINQNAHIRGDITSIRDTRLHQNSRLYGSLHTGRDIRLDQNSHLYGDAQSVRNLRLYQNAQVYGDADVGGTVTLGQNSAVHGELEQGVEVDPPEPPTPCDPLNVFDLVADSIAHYRPPGVFDALNLPQNNDMEILEDTAFASIRLRQNSELTLDAGNGRRLFVDGTFQMDQNSTLNIVNPSMVGSPRRVDLFIEGALDMGQGTTLNIDPGIVLRIFTKGNVLSGQNSNMNLASQTPSIVMDGQVFPTLSIYTSTSGQVRFRQGGGVYASVYAPLAAVNLDQNGAFFGAVVGRTVTTAQNHGFHYDEALKSVTGGPVVAGGGFRIVSWEEVRGGS